MIKDIILRSLLKELKIRLDYIRLYYIIFFYSFYKNEYIIKKYLEIYKSLEKFRIILIMYSFFIL
jgi:hypothetical protein